MTTLGKTSVTCAVCGSTHTFTITISTNAFGCSDLDGRPPSMARETMYTWVQECPDCGYAAGTVRKPASVSREWLQREAYINCEGLHIRSGLAREFYHSYMIALEEGRIENAAYTLLRCAWASDDAEDTETAVTVRLKAAELLLMVPEDENTESRMLLRMDLLRRAGQFENVLNEYRQASFKDPDLKKLAKYELKLAKKKDDRCHTADMK